MASAFKVLLTSVALIQAAAPAQAQQAVGPTPPPPGATLPLETAAPIAAGEFPDREKADEEPNQQDKVEGLQVEKVSRPSFLKGATLSFRPRSYYLTRDREEKQDNVGWALGGALEFKSGWAADIFQVGATLFTSQKLYGPDKYDGTVLFKPGQESFTVLGEAHVNVRLGDENGLRVGRQSFDLPWLARHDIRMVPNTFEAIAVGKPAKKGFAYIAGYVHSIKRKNDDEFVSMSQAAGASDGDKGLALVGAQYTFEDGSLVALTNQTTFQTFNTLFVKAERSFPLGENASLRLYGQYTNQRSIGDDLIGEFETFLASVKGEIFWGDASFRLAASTAGKERGLQSPFGGPPNYLSIIVDNFDRAGEDALMIGASYDFKAHGLPGFSAFTNISTGKTPDSGPNASPDETEYNLTVDYKFTQDYWAKGLWFRLRGAYIDQDDAEVGADDFFDIRVIVNYALDLL